ncbi:MAG: hypothetical protein P8X90_12705, partial [Desulfobacterales bacterium]
MMVEFMLNDGPYHFLRWHGGRICSHPPSIPLLDRFSMLNGHKLQQSYCNHSKIDKCFYRIHGVGNLAFGFIRHVFEHFNRQGLCFWNIPGFCPEMIAKSAENMFEHFECDFNLKSLGIEADNLRGGHFQIRASQHESLLPVLDQYKTQHILKRLPKEIQAKNRDCPDFTVDVYFNGCKVIFSFGKNLVQFDSPTIFRRLPPAAIFKGFRFICHSIVLASDDDVQKPLAIVPNRRLGY